MMASGETVLLLVLVPMAVALALSCVAVVGLCCWMLVRFQKSLSLGEEMKRADKIADPDDRAIERVSLADAAGRTQLGAPAEVQRTETVDPARAAMSDALRKGAAGTASKLAQT